jgi:hypothetical protein
MAVDAVFTSHGSLDFTLPCLILECFSQISFATLLLDFLSLQFYLLIQNEYFGTGRQSVWRFAHLVSCFDVSLTSAGGVVYSIMMVI